MNGIGHKNLCCCNVPVIFQSLFFSLGYMYPVFRIIRTAHIEKEKVVKRFTKK